MTTLHTVLVVGLLLVSAGYIVVRVKRAVHMLQLNSYFTMRFLRWMHKDRYMLSSWHALVALVIIPLSVIRPDASILVLLVFAAVGLTSEAPKWHVAKKPLVVTGRVFRLLTMTSILFAAIIAWVGAQLFSESASGVSHASLTLLATILGAGFVTATANVLTSPVEAAIASYFVADAKSTLARYQKLTVIGVTGSSGKTSTKHILASILGEKYTVLMTPASFNTTMGVVRTIRENLKPLHTVFIVEMGARQPGDIRKICEIVKPKYGILTCIQEQHLETFGSIERVADTKFELIEALPTDGIAFLNWDDPLIRSRNLHVRQIGYGVVAIGSGYQAEEIRASSTGLNFHVIAPNGERHEFSTILIGRHNVLNILAATAVGMEMGMSLPEIARAVRRLRPIEHRLELRPFANNVVIIDDAYNSNPAGARAALEALGLFDGYRKVLVTPGMVELGTREYDLNYEFGTQSAGVCDDIILVGRHRTKAIQAGIADSNFPADRLHVVENVNEALALARGIAPSDASILIENDLPDNYI